MKRAHAPQCPDCTYLLEGLTVPRCPECGLEFDPRLLADPRLARPRPAWERRPHVGLLRAAWRTLIDVTLRPRRFFGSIQQPDRLRRALSWSACMIAVPYLVVVAYVFAANRISGWGPQTWGMSWPKYCGAVLGGVAVEVLPGVSLVLLPLVALLAVADLILWPDRARYRLLFKSACYSMTVYVWAAVAVCGVAATLHLWMWWGGRGHPEPWPWTNWILAAVIVWQYVLVTFALLGRRFAALLPSRRKIRLALSWVVVMACTGAIYLTLYDYHLGLRFATARWSWEILR